MVLDMEKSRCFVTAQIGRRQAVCAWWRQASRMAAGAAAQWPTSTSLAPLTSLVRAVAA